tara:strand:+ start:480 stop:626 length:147 start_codon:yes stop_codon:yes gene_type:complete
VTQLATLAGHGDQLIVDLVRVRVRVKVKVRVRVTEAEGEGEDGGSADS